LFIECIVKLQIEGGEKMESSKAPSEKDKAREELALGIDIDKTRRRVEDVLRKGGPENVIKAAKMFDVPIAYVEQVPEIEIFLADVYDQLDEDVHFLSQSSLQFSAASDTGHKIRGERWRIIHRQEKILNLLPPRFNAFRLGLKWSGLNRYFFTIEAATKHKAPSEDTITKDQFNVVQMRHLIKRAEDVNQSEIPFEPDEEKEIARLKEILYPK